MQFSKNAIQLASGLVPLFSLLLMAIVFPGCGNIKGKLSQLTAPAVSIKKFDITFQQTQLNITEGGTAQLLIELSAAQKSDVSASLVWTSTNGDEQTRFQSLSQPIVIVAGTTSKSFVLNTIDDNIYQPTQNYQLSIVATNNAVQPLNNLLNITLADNDSPPRISFSVASQSVIENSGQATATVNLHRASAKAISVAYSAIAGSAIAGTNYSLSPGTLTFAPGEVTKSFHFNMIDDSLVTGPLSFTLSLGAITGAATLGTVSSQTVNEVDSQSANLTMSDLSLNEGQTATFTISTSHTSASPQTVHYQTVADSALAGVDFTSTSGTATIAAGQTSTTVSVTSLHTAGICSADRSFKLHLTTPFNATIATTDAAAIIHDVDVPVLSVADGSAAEGSSVSISATLSAVCATHDISFVWSNSAGNARAGTDYSVLTNQAATILAGATSVALSTPTAANHYNLGVTKTFSVTTSLPVGATLGTATAVGTITQSNLAPADPVLSLSDVSTSLSAYARQRVVSVGMTADSTSTRWCYSETQATKPALGTSNCAGGTGSSNGWFTAKPSPALYTVSTGDGAKQIYLWIADANNNVNAGAVSASITLDTVLPTVPTVSLSDPNTLSTSYTNQASVTLSISGDTDAVKWCSFEQASATTAPSAPQYSNACWTSTKPATLALGATGSRKVYFYTMNVAGGISSAAAQATINYSTAGVADPTLLVQDATTSLSTYARSTAVSLAIGSDSQATHWCVSESQTTRPSLGTSACTGGTGSVNGWYSTRPTSFTLSAGDGVKTVFVWVSDVSNNVNATLTSQSITLDTALPDTPTVQLADGNTASTTNTNQAHVSLSITSDTDSVKWCTFEQDSASPSPAAPLYSNICWDSPRPSAINLGATGNRKLYVYTKDVAGNVSAAAGVASIAYSVTAPSTPVLALKDPGTNSASFAKQAGVTATVTSDTGAVKWCLSESQSSKPALGTSICSEGAGPSAGWLTTAPTSFSLSTGDGVKTVYLWTADASNNVSAASATQSITLDTTPPPAPSALALSSPTSSPNTVATPVILISGVASGDIVTLYSNSSCSVAVSAGTTASGATVPVTTNTLSEAAYTFYAKSVDAAGNSALACSTASVAYVYDSTPLGAFAITGITGASDSTLDAYLNGGLTPKINWAASTNATSYDVTVYQSNGMTVQCSLQNTTALFYDFSSCTLVGGTSYKAQVTAKKPTGSSTSRDASNSQFSFTVNLPPTLATIATQYVMSGTAVTVDVLSGAACGVSGCTLSIQSVANGSLGTTSKSGSNVTYTGSSGTSGVDSFSYTIADGRGGTATGSISVKAMTAMTWTGNAGTTDWSTAGNWCGSVNGAHSACLGTGSVPGSSSDVIFDGTCASNCSTTIPASGYTVQSLSLNSGYSGTVSQPAGAGNTFSASTSFKQSAGTFIGGSADMQVGRFTLSGGSFTATSAYTRVSGGTTTWSVTGSPTFSANSGTIAFSLCGYCGITITSGTVAYKNVIFSGSATNFDLNLSQMTINGNVTFDDSGYGGSQVGNGTLLVSGNLVSSNNFSGGSALLKVVGNISGQTLSGVGNFPNLEIAAGFNDVTLSGTVSVYGGNPGSYTVTSAANLYTAGSTLRLLTGGYAAFSVTAGTWHYNNVSLIGSASTFTLNGTVFVDGNYLDSDTNYGGSSVNGNLEVKGDITVAGNAGGGTGLIKALGHLGSVATITGVASASLPNLEIAAAGYDIALRGQLNVQASGTGATFKMTAVNSLDVAGSTLKITGAAFAPISIYPGNVTYNNVWIQGNGSMISLNGSNMNVGGDLQISDLYYGFSQLNNGALLAQKNVVIGGGSNNFNGGTASLQFVGTTTQTLSVASALPMFNGGVTVNQSGSGKVVLATSVANASAPWTVTTGAIYLAGNSLSTSSLSLSGTTVHKQDATGTGSIGTLTVGGSTISNGPAFGGTVAN